jgi:Cu/Ag efflux protein CusF
MRKLIAASVVTLVATFSHPQAQGFPEMKATGVPGKATATRTATMTATIKAIDAATRSVTLQNQAGASQTIKAGPQVQRFDEFAVGDTILVVVEQELVLEYQSAGNPAVAPTAVVAGDRAGPDRAPEGVVAAGVQATVTVTAIDSPNRMVVFQGPAGNLYQVKAGPQVKLEKLKVGDRLLATYVEAVAVKLEKPAKK